MRALSVVLDALHGLQALHVAVRDGEIDVRVIPQMLHARRLGKGHQAKLDVIAHAELCD